MLPGSPSGCSGVRARASTPMAIAAASSKPTNRRPSRLGDISRDFDSCVIPNFCASRQAWNGYGSPVQSELEAVVVLGCRIDDVGVPSAAANRRISRAAAAFHEHKTGRILVSGGRRWAGLSEAEAFARALGREGVPGSAIELECRSLTTRDNARYSARWLLEQRISAVGLVTCDWHMRRALAHFEAFGILPVPLAARSPEEPPLRAALRAVRERASFLWASLLPAPLHELTRFFR